MMLWFGSWCIYLFSDDLHAGLLVDTETKHNVVYGIILYKVQSVSCHNMYVAIILEHLTYCAMK